MTTDEEMMAKKIRELFPRLDSDDRVRRFARTLDALTEGLADKPRHIAAAECLAVLDALVQTNCDPSGLLRAALQVLGGGTPVGGLGGSA